MSYEKLYQISFAIATLFAFTMFSSNLETTQRVYWAKTETKASTGVLETKKDRAEDSQEPIRQIKEEKPNCDAECKVETLIKFGITSKLANLIVSECKEWAIDPRHCIIVASSIIINESGGGKSNACVKRFNCMWIWSGKVAYTSYEESIANWVQKYNRWWKNAKDMSFFYASSWEIPPSRYCMSEDSSDSNVGCPIGKKITTNTWNKLNKLF